MIVNKHSLARQQWLLNHLCMQLLQASAQQYCHWSTHADTGTCLHWWCAVIPQQACQWAHSTTAPDEGPAAGV